MALSSDDEIFTSIIQSMGIHNYDPLVIAALNEYARRYAGSLLLDAKDYAEHADRPVSTIIFDIFVTFYVQEYYDDIHL